MRIRITVLLLSLVVACSSPVPRGILPPDKMYAAVKDIMQVDEFINGYLMKDSNLNLKQKRSDLYAQVFALHQTDRKQFYNSFTYYQKHPDLLKPLFDSLAVGLKKKEIKKEIKKALPAAMDTALQ